MRQILCAIAFLTRLPVPRSVHKDAVARTNSPRWYALVGLILGAIYAGFARLLLFELPPTVVAICVLALDGLLTGALHLDGLADMADGFGGGRNCEDALRIMRDHAIGSYGAVALILLLLLKATTLSALLSNSPRYWVLFIAPALARWAILLLALSAPYARNSTAGTGGLAKSFTRNHFVIATITCVPLPVLFGWTRTLTCWVAAAIMTMLISRICRSRIGGITGDTLGANVVICEAVQFVFALALIG